MAITKAERAERDEAVETLREMLPAGTAIYTKVVHVSRSGMSRDISVYIPVMDPSGTLAIRDITHLVARALGYSLNLDRWSMRVIGTGMDMCFYVAYWLGLGLHNDGYSIRKSDL